MSEWLFVQTDSRRSVVHQMRPTITKTAEISVDSVHQTIGDIRPNVANIAVEEHRQQSQHKAIPNAMPNAMPVSGGEHGISLQSEQSTVRSVQHRSLYGTVGPVCVHHIILTTAFFAIQVHSVLPIRQAFRSDCISLARDDSNKCSPTVLAQQHRADASRRDAHRS